MKRYLEKESSSSSESLSDPKEATMVIEQENPFRKEAKNKKRPKSKTSKWRPNGVQIGRHLDAIWTPHRFFGLHNKFLDAIWTPSDFTFLYKNLKIFK